MSRSHISIGPKPSCRSGPSTGVLLDPRCQADSSRILGCRCDVTHRNRRRPEDETASQPNDMVQNSISDRIHQLDTHFGAYPQYRHRSIPELQATAPGIDTYRYRHIHLQHRDCFTRRSRQTGQLPNGFDKFREHPPIHIDDPIQTAGCYCRSFLRAPGFTKFIYDLGSQDRTPDARSESGTKQSCSTECTKPWTGGCRTWLPSIAFTLHPLPFYKCLSPLHPVLKKAWFEGR
ncbi:hypothetical protein GE09DRAFT_202273 [Coniochaeta sp. 2T2.1]|nr:hypothetical protein GE09DRAFT_202273 [Coniochaeta sp. 2T2.1]